jgi:hypothetical protein
MRQRGPGRAHDASARARGVERRPTAVSAAINQAGQESAWRLQKLAIPSTSQDSAGRQRAILPWLRSLWWTTAQRDRAHAQPGLFHLTAPVGVVEVERELLIEADAAFLSLPALAASNTPSKSLQRAPRHSEQRKGAREPRPVPDNATQVGSVIRR